MLKMIRDITLNDMPLFYKAIFWSAIAELAKFGSIFIILWFVYAMLAPFLGGKETGLNELLLICGIGFAYMLICYFVSIPAYKATFVSTYAKSMKGRLALANHIAKLPLGFLESSNPARLSHSLMKDFFNLENANSHLLPQFCASLIVSFVIFVGLCMFNWQMALAFFCCIPFALVILTAARKFGNSLSTRHMGAILDASNHLNEYIDGIKEIKAHNLGGAKFKRLEKSFDKLRKESIRIEVGLMPFALATISCMGAGIGIMIAVGRGFLVSGEMSIIEYIGFILVGSKAFIPLLTFSVNFIELQYFAKSGTNILSLLSVAEMQGKDKDIPNGNDIVIENCSFSYKENASPVLKNINLTIPAKSTLAIVGPSGSGKSTLVKLIARFYDTQSGSIKIGDISNPQSLKDIKDLDAESLMSKYSMVFQNVYLFRNSIKANVAFGKDRASDKEIESAIIQAQASGFVDKLTNGIHTFIAEGGATLSGGEKQRISVARAILKDAPIILLDEITSSLDIYNEYALQKAINSLAKDKSMIIIAHKLKNIMDCDCIVFMKNGQIIESGTHAQLLSQNGEYAKMWAMQENLYKM